MVNGNLFILSYSQLITRPCFDDVLVTSSSKKKKSFKSHEAYFPKRHTEEKVLKVFPSATLWMSRK